MGSRRTQFETVFESGDSGLFAPSTDRIDALLRYTADLPNIENSTADERVSTPALPHSEVPAAEFYKHISAELTEPRRMRCLLGWCGTRTLSPKPDSPKDSTPASNDEFQALQAGKLCQFVLGRTGADIRLSSCHTSRIIARPDHEGHIERLVLAR